MKYPKNPAILIKILSADLYLVFDLHNHYVPKLIFKLSGVFLELVLSETHFLVAGNCLMVEIKYGQHDHFKADFTKSKVYRLSNHFFSMALIQLYSFESNPGNDIYQRRRTKKELQQKAH